MSILTIYIDFNITKLLDFRAQVAPDIESSCFFERTLAQMQTNIWNDIFWFIWVEVKRRDEVKGCKLWW